MATIKLYKWTNYNPTPPNPRHGFSLTGIMPFEFVGEVDEAREYELPEGFELAESNAGTKEVYDAEGRVYEIGAPGGKPVLIYGGIRIHLKEVVPGKS